MERRKNTLGTKCETYRCKATGKDNVVCLPQPMVVRDKVTFAIIAGWRTVMGASW